MKLIVVLWKEVRRVLVKEYEFFLKKMSSKSKNFFVKGYDFLPKEIVSCQKK
jgi:hypothetical protein